MIRVVALLIGLVCSFNISYGQSTLGGTILRIAPEREKLLQYIVDVHGVGNFDYTGKAKVAQKLGARARIEIDQHIEYSRLDDHAILAQRIKSEGESRNWLVVGESQGVSFLKEGADLRVNSAKLAPVPRDEFACRCIDPRAIGMMTLYDIKSKRSLETILGEQLGSAFGDEAVKQDGNLVRFEARSLTYAFDSKRGYWPTEMRFDTGGLKVQWKTEIGEVEGMFVPVKASLEADVAKGDTRKVEFVLKWSSINKPMPVGEEAAERLKAVIQRD